MGRRVSWISCLASSTRRVWATATGEAPRCSRNCRRSWRAPTPVRAASASGRRRPARPARSAATRAPRWRAAPARGRRQARFPGGSAGGDGSRPPARPRPWREDDIARQGRARRTDRTAVDARGLDRGEEASVVAGVAHADGAVAGVVIEIHAAMLTPVRDGVLAVFGPCCPADTDVRKPRAGVRRGPYILLRMPVLAARSPPVAGDSVLVPFRYGSPRHVRPSFSKNA